MSRSEALDERIGVSTRSRARAGHDVDRDERAERFVETAAATEARDDDDFLDDWQDVALPSLPPIPGYHVCYLSINHEQDSIYRRMQMGYTPIRPDEVPGFVAGFIQSGSIKGVSGDVIQVNEMVACKIPNTRYQRLMATRHHDRPIMEEQGINSSFPQNDIYEMGDGTFDAVHAAPKRAPDFIRAGY